jgi:protein-S-isoprenylcysteine O-methyltransferase Ste14
LSIHLSDVVRNLIIACVVIAMGVAVMARRTSGRSTPLLHSIGLVSVFIKAATSTGFGPVYTTGQILSGREPRHAIALSTFLRVPICTFAFLAYIYSNGIMDIWLPVVLTIGALAATPIGPSQTSKLTTDSGRMAVGVLAFFLGVYILMWLFIRPYLESIVENPFFWAMLSMSALMGCTATLLTKRLGKYLGLNAGCVGVFALGRFLIPIACCDQPQFHGGPVLAVLGAIIFVIGLVFLCSAFYINPWPAPDERYPLVTTGFYGFVRHPMYLGEVLWTLGWSVMFGSILGVALVPIWWGSLLFHAIVEEEHLEQRFGQKYTDYSERVTGRMLPGLPI